MKLNLLYPVMLFKKDEGHFFVCKDEQMLTTCSSGALKQKYYTDLLLIDSAGIEYRILKALKKGIDKKNFKWWYYIFGNFFIKIDLVFDDAYLEQRDIAFVRKIIIADIEENFEIWRESLDIYLIVKRIEIATSIQNIYKILINM